ncbi:MAG: sigma-70 family RNA polymerase sigma factor [Acidobacteriota bacterium]
MDEVERGARNGSENQEVTELLVRLGNGDRQVLGDLLPLVYEELRHLARRQVGRHRSAGATPTLDTTALVHEAYLKLAASHNPRWNDRCHFLAVAATAMRQILVDYARRRNAQRRGSNVQQLTLESREIAIEEQADSLLAVEGALTRLEQLSPRLARVVECTFFGGMTQEETAVALNVTERTIRRDWTKARAWLHRELAEC